MKRFIEYFNEKYNDIISKSIEIYGIKTNTLIFIEELAELTKAYIKYLRADNAQPEIHSYLDNVKEECADCMIMCQTLKIENVLEGWDDYENVFDTDKVDFIIYTSYLMTELRKIEFNQHLKLENLLGFCVKLTRFISNELKAEETVEAVIKQKIQRLESRIEETLRKRSNNESNN